MQGAGGGLFGGKTVLAITLEQLWGVKLAPGHSQAGAEPNPTPTQVQGL